jgi:hypothetical protein
MCHYVHTGHCVRLVRGRLAPLRMKALHLRMRIQCICGVRVPSIRMPFSQVLAASELSPPLATIRQCMQQGLAAVDCSLATMCTIPVHTAQQTKCSLSSHVSNDSAQQGANKQSGHRVDMQADHMHRKRSQHLLHECPPSNLPCKVQLGICTNTCFEPSVDRWFHQQVPDSVVLTWQNFRT